MNKKNEIAALHEFIDQFEAEQKAKYSLESMKQMLGEQPWDCNLIAQLYIKNFMGMTKILGSCSGSKVFLALLEFRNMMRIASTFKEKTLAGIEDVNQKLINKSGYLGTTEDYDNFFANQETINIHFFGYVSACYALIQLQTRLQKKYSLNKKVISGLFENILENDCHHCLMFLRNKIIHGVFLRFTSKITISYNPHNKHISFILDAERVKSLEVDGPKDRKGRQYLLDNSCDLQVILTKHFELLSQFFNSVYITIFNEHKKEIVQCNEYFKTVTRQTEAQMRAIAHSVGKNLPHAQAYGVDSETYYLERAMGYRFY